MTQNRFDVPIHPYRLEYFPELGSKIIGPDERCTCTCADYCPLGKSGASTRCTVEELKQYDREAQRRRAWQSGHDWP